MIEVGDRVTYKNLEGNIVTTLVHNNVDKIATKEILKTRELIKIERPEWRVVEEKKELLTEEEKELKMKDKEIQIGEYVRTKERRYC